MRHLLNHIKNHGAWVTEALSFFFIPLKRSLIFFLYIFPSQKRKCRCHFQWGLPFISLAFQVSKWYPIYLYSSASAVKHTSLSAEHKFRCSVLESHTINKLTISTAASHLAGNFRISAAKQSSKLFSNSIYNIPRVKTRFFSLNFWDHISFVFPFYFIKDVFGMF